MLDLLMLTLPFLPSFIADVKSELRTYPERVLYFEPEIEEQLVEFKDDNGTVMEAFVAFPNELRTYPERVLYFEPEIEEQLVEFKDDNGTVMEAFVAFPKTGSEKPLPAVVIYPTFAGRTDFEDRHARELAKIVAIGFCFGGLMALDLARWGAPLRGVFVFHATLTGTNGTSNSTISLPIEAHHGDQDPFTNANQVDGFLEEMRSRAEDWMFIRHSGAEHAFTMPEVDDMNIPGASYNEQATRRSWKSLIRFLKDHNE